ncbi:MAG TPA: nuclear transport factor 2 family protein [Thermoleophilaceae bacterium]
MTPNRTTVDELIRRMNARDLHPTELCHDDVEWHWPATTPGASVFHGHAGVTEGLEQWSESWDELNMEPEEILEEGDWVLAVLRYRMRGAGSGVYLESSVAHLHQLEDGKLRRWWMFGNSEKARRRFLAGDRPD